jgi:predicted AlkP superfamily pyrophosphatase or phosphodiesterase
LKPLLLGLCAAIAAVSPLLGRAPAAARPIAAIRHAVIVSVDGMRPDLLVRGPAPHMRALMQRGSYSLWARTVEEVYTVPSHVSMLTGVTPTRHGVTWDNHIEDSYPNVPTLFELARRAGYTTAIAVGKSKFVVLTKPGTLNWSYLADEDADDDADVARRAAAMIRDHRPDVLFVHFGSFDQAGHASGWGSPQQMLALKRADDAFGVVQRALKAAGLDSSTVIILTADHGGAGLLHPPEDVRSQFIPWIVAGPSIRRNFDLTSVPDLAVDTMSTFATVCTLLGIDLEQPVDGKPVLQILEPRK